jgi:hypothetical protein
MISEDDDVESGSSPYIAILDKIFENDDIEDTSDMIIAMLGNVL